MPPHLYKPFTEMRPTVSQTVEAAETGLDGLSEFFASLDSQKVLTFAGIAATVGVGGFALYYSGRNRGKDPDKKRSRVSFEASKDSKKVATPIEKQKPEAGASAKANPSPDVNANVVSEVIITNKSATSVLTKKENVLVLKQCPRGRKTPCIAPFPLKLESFLRVHGIKYGLDFNGHEPKLYGSPWIRFNTEDITDSENVVQFLIDQYDIQIEKKLDNEQRAMATAYSHLLENHLYWGIALWRWVYDGARSLKEIQLLPRNIQELIPDVCRTVAQAAWFHGIGKLTPAEVKAAVLKDLSSLSEFLGKKSYFLDTEVPTELDCTAFGMLAQFLWNMKGPFHDAIANDHPNLREFCWRMRQTYWPDWEDCLNNKDFYTSEPYPMADNMPGSSLF